MARRWGATLPPHVPSVDVVMDGPRPTVILQTAVRNIYCIGRNYEAHARELGNAVPTEEPVVFLKASSSLRGLEGDLAFTSETFHFECELVFLVGKHVPLGSLRPGHELDCLQAVGLGLDLTRRSKQTELKTEGKPWTVSKSFCGSAIVAPMRTLQPEMLPDLDSMAFELLVNGERRQHGHANHMIFDVPFLLHHLNSMTALLPGDLLFTGTPEGVGEISRGDHFQMRFLSGPLGRSKSYNGVL